MMSVKKYTKRQEHITVIPAVFKKFLEICEYHKRTQRAQVTKWIEEEHKKLFGKDDK